MSALFSSLERDAFWEAQGTQDARKSSEQLAGRHSGLAGCRLLHSREH